MNLQTEKRAIIERFKLVKEASLVEAIKQLLDYGLQKQQSIYDGRITIEKYNEELAQAENRIANGLYITHENLEKEAKQWKR